MKGRRRILWFAAVIAITALLARYAQVAARRLVDRWEVPASAFLGDETPYGDSARLVLDPHAGFRLRRHAEGAERSAPLGRPTEMTTTTWHGDAQGLMRSGDALQLVDGPRILLCGDEQVFAGVDESARVATLLQDALRAEGDRLAHATVIDASCPRSSLLHRTLRLPDLVKLYRPHVVILVVSTGDDLVAFVDRSSPWLGPTFDVEHADAVPTEDVLGLGRRAMEVLPSAPGLWVRGLAQREYAAAHPDFVARLPRLLDRCIAWARTTAPRGGLLLCLVPPADLARPTEVAAILPDALRTQLHDDVARDLHEQLAHSCERVHVGWVDALDALAKTEGADVYRSNGCLGAAGHRTVAVLLAHRLRDTFRSL
ncbi:MAG: hypothetical protein U1F36_05615 [Planctomycetota bacterium]